MTIKNFDNDYLCIHRPIPIIIEEENEDVRYIEITLREGTTQITRFRADLSPDKKAYIDFSPWFKLCAKKLLTSLEYRDTIVLESREYIDQINIEFKTVFEDENLNQTTQLTKNIVHCYNNSVLLTDNSNVRAWYGYPFSVQCGNQIAKGIPLEDVEIDGRCVEMIYDTNCCGTYIKWLNEYGFFNYWMFPNRLIETESEEIYRINRDVFNSNQNSLIDTVGFDKTTTYTLKDLVPKAFFSLFNSLSSSPEVYLLRTDWSAGETLIASPMDWAKVIQDFTFEREVIRRNMAEVEVKIEVPILSYSQKRI